MSYLNARSCKRMRRTSKFAFPAFGSYQCAFNLSIGDRLKWILSKTSMLKTMLIFFLFFFSKDLSTRYLRDLWGSQ